MKHELRVEIKRGGVDSADFLPWLRAAASCQGPTAEWFALQAQERGDQAALLWALLTADQQYHAYLDRCRRIAQLEEELRHLKQEPLGVV